MPRFVLSHRMAGRGRDGRVASRAEAVAAFDRFFARGATVVTRRSPADDADREVIVFDADPAFVTGNAALTSPDVLIEGEQARDLSPLGRSRLGVESTEARRTPAVLGSLGIFGISRRNPFLDPLGTGSALRVHVVAAGAPVPGADVVVFLHTKGLGRSVWRRTDPDGRADFDFDPQWTVETVEVGAAGFWSTAFAPGGDRDRRAEPEPVSIELSVPLEPLPETGPAAWWHRLGGLGGDPGTRPGDGVVVGVVDSGVGPHRDLAHVQTLGSYLDNVHVAGAEAGLDSGWHGTHVAGIVGARPAAGSGRPAGLAPGARLLSARVFEPRSAPRHQDIAVAVDDLAARGADLVNLSVEAPTSSELELDAIRYALERGTLCVASAGNTGEGGGDVQFPGAYEEVVAVSALGLTGWAPPGSMSAACEPADPDRHGESGLFLADFSSTGPEVDASGPGVGVISTMPDAGGEGWYAAQDGTSMASPYVVGVLAALLSRDAGWSAMPRDAARAEHARALLRQACRDVGLGAFGGSGVPSVAAALPRAGRLVG
ncbi:MAG TPA: S8 family serine peptidase [Mycobacteriales bacterium]